jgi:hypothetical protein
MHASRPATTPKARRVPPYTCAIVGPTRFVMSPDGRLCVRRALEGPPAITSAHQPLGIKTHPQHPSTPTALITAWPLDIGRWNGRRPWQRGKAPVQIGPMALCACREASGCGDPRDAACRPDFSRRRPAGPRHSSAQCRVSTERRRAWCTLAEPGEISCCCGFAVDASLSVTSPGPMAALAVTVTPGPAALAGAGPLPVALAA